MHSFARIAKRKEKKKQNKTKKKVVLPAFWDLGLGGGEEAGGGAGADFPDGDRRLVVLDRTKNISL